MDPIGKHLDTALEVEPCLFHHIIFIYLAQNHNRLNGHSNLYSERHLLSLDP